MNSISLTAPASNRRIIAAFGDGSVFECTLQDWFTRVHAEDYILEHASLSGLPSEVDDGRLREMVEDDPCHTRREITSVYIIQPSVVTSAKRASCTSWPNGYPTNASFMTACDGLRRALPTITQTHAHCLSMITTGGKKCCVYVNIKRCHL